MRHPPSICTSSPPLAGPARPTPAMRESWPGLKKRSAGPSHVEGDKIFLRLLEENVPFFSLKLQYQGDRLDRAVLNGRRIV